MNGRSVSGRQLRPGTLFFDQRKAGDQLGELSSVTRSQFTQIFHLRFEVVLLPRKTSSAG